MTYRNADKISEQIKKIVEGKVKSSINRGLNLEYANILKDRIVKRTTLGIGVDPETGRGSRLKKLTPKYANRRKKLNLAATTSPAKSNLTATGQLLRSLTVVKIKIKGTVQFLFTVGDRRGRNADGKTSKIGNKLLLQYVKAQGRDFLGFTKAQRNEITRDIKDIIVKFIK